MDVGELLWFGVLHRPKGVILYGQGKHELCPSLGLAYLYCRPFVDGRLLCWEGLTDCSFPIESGADVDSFGLVDPQGRSSVSNVPSLASFCQLQDLRKAVGVVAGWLELEGDFPLIGEGREGCQKGVSLQQMFCWKGE